MGLLAPLPLGGSTIKTDNLVSDRSVGGKRVITQNSWYVSSDQHYCFSCCDLIIPNSLNELINDQAACARKPRRSGLASSLVARADELTHPVSN